MQSHTITVDNIPMRWLEEGETAGGVTTRPTVIFVHGIPTSPLLWRHVIPRVEEARCLAWEMVGYGDSIPAGHDRDISVAKQADYLLAWMDAIGVESAILAGHDLGGGVVQIAAVRKPDVCQGLFLTNAIGYDSWPIPSVKVMRATGLLVEAMPNAVFKSIYSTFLHRGHDSTDLAEEAVACHWPFYESHGGAADMIRQVRSLDVNDTLAIADDLPKLNVPARVVWGVDDQFQKIEYGERFAHDLQAPLRRIEGAKHFTPEDHPDIIAEEINLLVQQADEFSRAAS